MPTYKRYIYRNNNTVYFFTRKPGKIYSSSWDDLYGHLHPICCLQENEADFDFSDLPKNKLIEVTMAVKLKEE